MRRAIVASLAALVSAGGHAYAEPDRPLDPPDDRPTAGDVAGKPPPGGESGRTDAGTHDSAGRRTARAILKVPRGLLEIVMAPVRVAVWAYDRYDIVQRYDRLGAGGRGFSVSPSLQFDSGWGATVGGELNARINGGAVARLYAGTGGRYRYNLTGGLRMRAPGTDRIGVALDGGVQRHLEDSFYGVGNAEVMTPQAPADALVGTSREGSYRRRIARAFGVVDVRLIGPLHVRGGVAAADVTLEPGREDTPITDVYRAETLVGLGGYQYHYGEVGLSVDTRGPATVWQPAQLVSKGSLLMVYGGRQGIDSGARFWRYGVDAQQFLPLGAGPRTLSLRFHGEAVAGAREEVPFPELPFLGGPRFLRGYATERFRDRVAAVATAEYQWDLSENFYVSVFVDSGRVFPGLDALTLAGMRHGFGVALEMHGHDALVGRVSLATSVDGGVFVNLYLDPVFTVSPRLERRR